MKNLPSIAPLFLTSSPPPRVIGTDAVYGEVSALSEAFRAPLVHLHPFANPAWRIPNFAQGITRLPTLTRENRRADIVHLFTPAPYDFPVLRLFSVPIVYTITASLGSSLTYKKHSFLNRMAAVIVSNPRDKAILCKAGLANVFEVRPGVELLGFATLRQGSVKSQGRFTLLSASAPWTQSQFVSKGINALLDCAAMDPSIELIIALRGSFQSKLRAAIAERKIENSVRILDGHQDLTQVMKNSDAVVLAGTEPAAIKAWPHSLLEGLAAGRPVITSHQISVSDYIEEHGCGIVLKQVDGKTLFEGVQKLRDQYSKYQTAALGFDWKEFSPETMINAYNDIYRSVLNDNDRNEGERPGK